MVSYGKQMRERAKTDKAYLCTIDCNDGELRWQGPVSKDTAAKIGNFLAKLLKEKKA